MALGVGDLGLGWSGLVGEPRPRSHLPASINYKCCVLFIIVCIHYNNVCINYDVYNDVYNDCALIIHNISCICDSGDKQ